MNDTIITTDGVKKLLDDLNVYKANGPDGIPARMLKETSDKIVEAMMLLFKASLTQSGIPDTWTEALISPSLTTISFKVLEYILHSNILKNLESNSILTNLKHGFRKHRSCETQLIKTVNDPAKAINHGEQISSTLMNFSNCLIKYAIINYY